MTRNSYTPYDTSLLHNSINEILKRRDLDVILLQISYPTNLTLCTSSSSLINSITSLMYIINNPNIYFHVDPVYFENPSYNQLDSCYTDSMHLPLGNFRNTITNISEIIRATTTDGGYLLVREYEGGNGVILYIPSNNTGTSETQSGY